MFNNSNMSDLAERAKRPVSIQAEFVSYFEKHRIYELLYELATELLVQRPENPTLFLKDHLDRIIRKRDVPRVILIAPPDFDRMRFAEVLCNELSIRPLTRKDLCDLCLPFDDACQCDELERIEFSARKILRDETVHRSGWILVDVPRTKKEAEVLQRSGMLPTCVIQILSSQSSEQNTHTASKSRRTPCDRKPVSPTLQSREYERNLQGLREAYSEFLIEVDVGIRSVTQLGKDCVKLAKKGRHSGAPSLFRVVLIGSRGSGCTTVAKYISKRYDLVHSNVSVDFDYLAEQTRLQQNVLGKLMRFYDNKCGEKTKPEVTIKIVEKHVLSYEALKRGWIMTGYPKTVEEFKLLDLISTPPNRVIFIEASNEVCRQRLLNRRYNIVTGSKHDLSREGDPKLENCDGSFGVHPRDYKIIVERDLQEYEEHMGSMLEYAGESAVRVDGSDEERTVRERVEACLIRAAPNSKPRDPNLPVEVDFKDMEFEPDDEPYYDFPRKRSECGGTLNVP